MISGDLAEKVLAEVLKGAGDFAEIFVEDRITNSIKMVDSKIEEALTGRDYGAGIRVMSKVNSVYVYTNDLSLKGLMDAAGKASIALKGQNSFKTPKKLEPQTIAHNLSPVKMIPSKMENSLKAKIVGEAYKGARDYSPQIVQVTVGYGDTDQEILIANSEGLFKRDRRVRTRIFIQSVAGDGTQNQTGFEGPGRSMGFEMFDQIDGASYGREASRTAVTMLGAKVCPAGRMCVVLNNGFGGVIFHEACGHALEATSVAKGLSVFTDKMNQPIASPVVTAIDDGTIPHLWGSTNMDDEGNPTQKNLLIEKGILKGYMVDRLNGRRLNAPVTGNSRRQSYRYAPTSRMTNTYIAPGNDGEKDIFSDIEHGLFARKLGGGSVNPVTGEFNFAVAEGYIIDKGEIKEPVRGATLIGRGDEILFKIDRVGKDLEFGQGQCGSISGTIPANVGQPVIRVSEMTVGGR